MGIKLPRDYGLPVLLTIYGIKMLCCVVLFCVVVLCCVVLCCVVWCGVVLYVLIFIISSSRKFCRSLVSQ